MKLQRNVRIKGKLWAGVIKLSGAAQSAAGPFNLTSSDWGTNEKKKVFWHRSGPKKPTGSFRRGTNVPFSSHLEYFQPRQIKLFQVHRCKKKKKEKRKEKDDGPDFLKWGQRLLK